MPKSLRCKLSDLRYKRLITDEEYQEMIKNMEDCINWYDWLIASAKQLKGE